MSVSATTTTTSSVRDVPSGTALVPIVLRITDASGRKIYPLGEVSSLFALCAIKIRHVINVRKKLNDYNYFRAYEQNRDECFLDQKSFNDWYDQEVSRLPFMSRLYQMTLGSVIQQSREGEWGLRPNGETYREYTARVETRDLNRFIVGRRPQFIQSLEAIKNSMKQRLPEILHHAIEVRTVKFTNVTGHVYNITMSGGVPGVNFQDLAIEVNRLLGGEIFQTRCSWNFTQLNQVGFRERTSVFSPETPLSDLNVHQLQMSSDPSYVPEDIFVPDSDLKQVIPS